MTQYTAGICHKLTVHSYQISPTLMNYQCYVSSLQRKKKMKNQPPSKCNTICLPCGVWVIPLIKINGLYFFNEIKFSDN